MLDTSKTWAAVPPKIMTYSEQSYWIWFKKLENSLQAENHSEQIIILLSQSHPKSALTTQVYIYGPKPSSNAGKIA